jgi:antitoxin (DNA-binding transcriptional repressor) of toxin-antitoxin stability system
VAGEDVIRRDGVVILRVGEPAARVVPVLARWSRSLGLTASSGNEFLVGGESLAINRAGDLARKFVVGHRHPKLSTPRLRSTWLVHHLTIGPRLPELARAAGMVGVTLISDLLPDVAPLPDGQEAVTLRGAS